MNRLVLISVLAVAAAVGGLVALTGDRTAGPRAVFGSEPGELTAGFSFRDLDGERGSLAGLLDGAEALVVVMRDSGCPAAQRYGPELARIEREYGERGVRFLFVNSNAAETPEAIREAELEAFAFAGRYVHDRDGRIARRLGALTTTEAFVIDAAGTLRYRGAVDDQYGVTFTRREARHRYLRDALDAVLAGGDPKPASTRPEGCFLEGAGTAELPERAITFHNRVGRIVQQNCVTCHRDGGVAPFSLTSYEQVRAYAPMIRYMTGERRMPPWFADPEHGRFANDRSLSARDLADLHAWIDAGAPEGDPGEAAAPRNWPDGWYHGEPDAVVALPEPIAIPADGVVEYQYVYVKTDFPEDRWIQAMEISPTAMTATHHVLVFIEDPDAERKRGGIDGFFAGWAPGNYVQPFPEGSAKLLPKGAWLKFQLHYTPNGTATEDQTRLGFFFADSPPTRVVETSSAFDYEFLIPPHAENHEVAADYTFRRSGTLLSFFPHMHLRGKAFRYELVRPDGTSEILLDVPRYDFNWQLVYELAEPIRVEAGAVLRATGWFDNSANNPWNPDPDAEVAFGEQTFEEMMIGYFDWIPDPAARSGVVAEAAGGAP